MKRRGISTKTRFEIFKRDGFRCNYCGCAPPNVVLEVDHIVAVADGGGNEMDNLVTACFGCNRGKAANPLTAVPQSLAEKASLTQERERQLKAYAEVMADARERIESEAWMCADIFATHFEDSGIRADWLQSIKRFLQTLPAHELYEAMDSAIAKRPRSKSDCFRYFCGICWSKVREATSARPQH